MWRIRRILPFLAGVSMAIQMDQKKADQKEQDAKDESEADKYNFEFYNYFKFQLKIHILCMCLMSCLIFFIYQKARRAACNYCSNI